MFAKLLVLLISNIFVSFSVLFCCGALVLKCGLKDGNWPKCTSGPDQCARPASVLERTMCDRAQQRRLSALACEHIEPRSSALNSSARSAIERMPHQPHILHCPSCHCFMLCAVGILSGYVRLSEPSAIERKQACARVHCLQSSAPLTWQHIKFCL